MEHSVVNLSATPGGDRPATPCPWLARLSAPIVSARLLLVVAHPDDETIGAGALLARSIDAHIAMVTNGAPSDRHWWPAGIATAAEYAAVRQEELRSALEQAGIGFERVHLIGVTDGEASESIPHIARRLTALIDGLNPDIVLTHAYEGGHPDHDATAIAVHAAMAMTSRGHPHEMATYHGTGGDDLAVHAFLPGTGPVYTAVLDDRLRETKSAMLSSYHTQQQHAAYFGVELERFRCAPAYDFLRSPDPGRTLLYERSDEHAGERFRARAAAALQDLGLMVRLGSGAGSTKDSGSSLRSLPATPDGNAASAQPLVSVIVRTVGRATLGHALSSIASQTHRAIEVVLVNASTQDIRVTGAGLEHLRLRECGGVALDRPAAANVGLKAATGDYVMFLDDDDWFHPEHVESLVAGLRRASDARVAYAGVEVLEWLDDGPPRRRWTFDSPFDPIGLLCENYIPLNAVLIDRQLLGEVEWFDEQLHVYEDWDFLIGLSRKSRFEKVPGISAAYRWPPGSGVTDASLTAPAQARVYAKWRGTLSTDEYVALLQRAVAESDLRTGSATRLRTLQSLLDARDDELEQLRPCVRAQEQQLAEFRRHLSATNEELEQLRPCVRAQEQQLEEFRTHFAALNEELERLRRAQQDHLHAVRMPVPTPTPTPMPPPVAVKPRFSWPRLFGTAAAPLAASTAAAAPLAAGSLTFRCNICGQSRVASMSDIDREVPSCSECGSTVRFRSIVHALSMELFGQSMALPDFPERRDLKGVGMSDWEGYAGPLSAKFDYQNTHYHKEPRLDIAAVDPSLDGLFDFAVSSEVFEHVPPPVERAFDNVFRLLKPGGVLVFSVPYHPTGTTIEHYPDLHDYQLITTDHGRALRNTTVTGELQLFTNLVFHGGDGSTLEMRVFTEPSLLEQFRRAGFRDPLIYKEPCFEHGVYARDHWSLTMSVRKPAAK